MAEPFTCNPGHAHADSLTCYTRHRCRCEPCVTRYRAYATERRKLKAYGRYERRVDTLGTVRRLHGLQLLGWRYEDVGDLIGMNRRNVRAIQFAGWIHPETRDAVKAATRTLMARGQGPSIVARKRAEAKGYVPLLSWNDIDRDRKPVTTHDRMLRGPKLFGEIDHLRDGGESPDQIARTFGKTANALERASYNAGRKDLAAFFARAAKREAA